VEEEEDDDSDDYLSTGSFEIVQPVTDKAAQFHGFIEALAQCEPLILGFHCSYNNRWCYCPLGKHMKTWREHHDLDEELSNECSKGGKSKFTPEGLLAHLRDLAEDRFHHSIVLHYLEQLYKNYVADTYFPKAFYGLNDKIYKIVNNLEKKEVLR